MSQWPRCSREGVFDNPLRHVVHGIHALKENHVAFVPKRMQQFQRATAGYECYVSMLECVHIAMLNNLSRPVLIRLNRPVQANHQRMHLVRKRRANKLGTRPWSASHDPQLGTKIRFRKMPHQREWQMARMLVVTRKWKEGAKRHVSTMLRNTTAVPAAAPRISFPAGKESRVPTAI